MATVSKLAVFPAGSDPEMLFMEVPEAREKETVMQGKKSWIGGAYTLTNWWEHLGKLTDSLTFLCICPWRSGLYKREEEMLVIPIGLGQA